MRYLILLLLTGCASPCFVEVGQGRWINSDEAPGYGPTEINAYCEKSNWQYGWYHRSDIARGQPFNDQEEDATDAVMLKYRLRIR
jgi:hypothetical protein